MAGKRSTKARRVRVQLDSRTTTMTADALECRAFNHNWQRQPTPPHRLLEMLDNGYVERVRICQCGCEWIQVYSIASGTAIINRRTYPKDGYLVPKGTGRLRKADAVKAALTRELPDHLLAA